MPDPDLFLLRLARALLDKAERTGNEQGIKLKLDRKHAPELYGHIDADSQQAVVLKLETLCALGWTTLDLGKPRDFAGFTDRDPHLVLLDFEALAAWCGYQRRADAWHRQLIQYIELSGAFGGPGNSVQADLLDYLSKSPLRALEGWPLHEAADCLLALHALCVSGQTMPLREASARVFHARSKILDHREELLRLLGAASGQLFEAPIQLLMAFPEEPENFDAVLFVENLVTFERMADHRQADWAHMALVYAAGFKAGAKRLRHPQGCRIYSRQSAAPTQAALERAARWLFDNAEMSVFFFGDLDFAGMQILARLRDGFPQACAWETGYAPLADILSHRQGHPPEAAEKSGQIDPGITGCTYADNVLLPLMRQSQQFADQESYVVRA
ncbi:uncharacterized protein DUF2220 [Aquabacterium commune]|uniref:Uncharacterized protein DUF2220 n=1 Tax=Aquabacterium commune TaxID=70586 RepID=A0A4R6RA19_9BURK|nr:DUF2220 family protein [Aquabacterium commune]TDP82931.1 uncharacterized protein DUF2220 [Aquabacterium commune]